MVRPRGFEAERAADGLMNAFWLRGFARTSIADLTAATGLLPGSLYGAFGGKEQMFRLAIERYTAELRDAITDGGPGLDGIAHALDAIVRLTAQDPERRGCLILNAIPEAGSLSEETRAELDAGLAAMRAFLRARLREAQAAAGTRAELAPLEALLFAAAVSIRVLGRAGQSRRLLQDIAHGAVAAARRAFEPG